MTVENLEQQLKEGILNSIYLFYGEEEFLLDTNVKKIKKLFGDLLTGINYIQLDETNINTLISEIETPAFGYEKKLIIVKHVGLFKNLARNKKNSNGLAETIAKYITENAKLINSAVVLIFIEEEANKNELYNIIEKNGIICNFTKLKPVQISQRLKVICNAYKVKIDAKTMNLFIETCGTNMQVLINEIRKLIEYAGKDGTITAEAIEKLSIKEFDSIIFDLTDNLGKKNIKEALNILNELLYNKEPIQKILITLYGHFKKLYLTILAMESNRNIIEALNLKPNQEFLANKYRRQASFFNKKEIKKILQELINLDYNSKQGNIDINIGLEAILCTYCG